MDTQLYVDFLRQKRLWSSPEVLSGPPALWMRCSLLWASTVTAKHNRRKFYLGIADKLDALRRALPREREIDNKFAAFLANAAREIREDTDTVARRLSGEPDMLGLPVPSDLKLMRRAS
ncbi:MAG TPA: hypothetical protein VHT51_18725 [Micropepsaceae bacterium]|nr:hypothetical protein [Micropepsaceae bacterium]